MTAELHVLAAARLRREDQRYTSNRRALVDALQAADGPLTIPELLERCPGVPQSSAYRNLALLEQARVVHRIVTTDEFARFELTEELTEDHHHHLICSRCGSVTDFSVPPSLERRLEKALDEVAGATGFAAEHHRFDLVGRCADCA
ncbi:MAG: transcriptional repressor [Actinobacteria bacterium]|nr:transcriptional repressor [Actinomycetota bacterium]